MTARNWLNITQQMSMLAVVAFTMTIVMVMGDFDLSVGSMASLAGVVAAMLFAPRLPGRRRCRRALCWSASPAALINGFLVSIVGILPFIATLGTLTVFSGLAFLAQRRQDDLRPRHPGRPSAASRAAASTSTSATARSCCPT